MSYSSATDVSTIQKLILRAASAAALQTPMVLQPGETTTFSVATPPLGHGQRYVRANSAAIGCETRVADNSRVFRLDLR